MARSIWPGALVSSAITAHETAADPHTPYLRSDGTRDLAGNMAATAGVTIDGRDVGADGALQDTHLTDPSGAHPQYQPDALFGDGSDGTVVIGAPTTLTKAMFYDDLRVSAGQTLATDGFPVYVRGTLTIEATGEISMDGNDAVGITPGAAYPASGVLGAQSGAGATGRNTVGVGAAGASPPANQMHPGGQGSAGAGGAAGGQAGGAGGASTSFPATFGKLLNLAQFQLGFLAAQGVGGSLAGGAGGGGGGCDPGVDTATSGGGGGGAGTVLVACYDLNNLGTISADGGVGGDGVVTGVGVAGGGGGGSGGQVHVFAWKTTALGTVQASGGAGGAAAGGGAVGVAGAAGYANTIQAT
jgi:hypothetical protein